MHEKHRNQTFSKIPIKLTMNEIFFFFSFATSFIIRHVNCFDINDSLQCYSCDHSESLTATGDDKDYSCIRNFSDLDGHKRICLVGETFCKVIF